MSISDEKKRMRQEAIRIMSEMTANDRQQASAAIQETVIASPEYLSSANILVYLSFKTEVATDLIVKAAWRDDKRLFAPKFIDGDYRILPYSRRKGLQRGKYGILEPAGDSEDLPANEILALVPGVAFDRQCARLGRGGGYYDRLLARISACRRVLAMGLTYDMTLYDKVPTESFDRYMDIVITEKESFRRMTKGAGSESKGAK